MCLRYCWKEIVRDKGLCETREWAKWYGNLVERRSGRGSTDWRVNDMGRRGVML